MRVETFQNTTATRLYFKQRVQVNIKEHIHRWPVDLLTNGPERYALWCLKLPQQPNCLFSNLFELTWKRISKLHIAGPYRRAARGPDFEL